MPRRAKPPLPASAFRSGTLASFRILGLVCGLGLLTACAHYRLGNEAKTHFATLCIAPVTASTAIPGSSKNRPITHLSGAIWICEIALRLPKTCPSPHLTLGLSKHDVLQLVLF